MSGRVRRSSLNVPGMPCPECEARIVIEPGLLLSAAPIRCPGCGLTMEVDTEESAEALQALQRYMKHFEALEERLERTVEEADTSSGPRGARPPGRRARRRSRRRSSRRRRSDGE